LIRIDDWGDVAEAALAEAFLSMELLAQSRELLVAFTQELGMVVIKAALNASAMSVAGPAHPGKKGSEIRHWGSQAGSVRLGPSKTLVNRPRLRDRSSGKEVPVPAYEALKKDPKAKKRMLHAALRGVSSRDFKEVVAGSAEALGVSRSSVSRAVVEEGAAQVESLMSAALPCRMLCVVIDGIRFDGHLVVGSIGIDESREKHVLGISLGSTENTATVEALLTNLRDRGLLASTLFIVDWPKP